MVIGNKGFPFFFMVYTALQILLSSNLNFDYFFCIFDVSGPQSTKICLTFVTGVHYSYFKSASGVKVWDKVVRKGLILWKFLVGLEQGC